MLNAWTPEELARLEDIKAENRVGCQIASVYERIGLHKMWTPDEDTILTKLRAEGHTTAQCAAKMKRPKGSIIGRLYRVRTEKHGPAAPRTNHSERNAEIRRLVLSGKTVSDIRALLNLTRGTVRGVVKAAKLTVMPTRQQRKRVLDKAWFLGKPPNDLPRVVNPDALNNPIDHAIPESQRVQLFDFTDHTCRWPIGEPSWEMSYCGAETNGRRSYCAEHHARAYQP